MADRCIWKAEAYHEG